VKPPHYFSASSGQPLAFAGLWERWRDPERDAHFDSATIIVGAANQWMSAYHDRTPIIRDWGNADAWLRAIQ
jgi:putative SOS response-associated peptidase YedK